jgi:hypothetical protein
VELIDLSVNFLLVNGSGWQKRTGELISGSFQLGLHLLVLHCGLITCRHVLKYFFLEHEGELCINILRHVLKYLCICREDKDTSLLYSSTKLVYHQF